MYEYDGGVEMLWRTCKLTAHSSTGPVVHPFSSRHEGPGFNPRGVLMWNRDSPDSVISLHWSPPKPSLGCCADNVIIPVDLTQLFCPSFILAGGPPSSFTTDIVGCWGGALWRTCNLTAHSSTGPVVHPFASRHEGPGFNPQGGTYVKPGFSCYRCLATMLYLA
jgi:hypothetical protein